jgi:serine/threonine protein kinase
VVHRDLKPENILLATRTGNDRNLIKLADFGLSKSIGESMRTYVGTPQYLPPELVRVKNNPHAEHYTPVVDMWSAGVIIFVTYVCDRAGQHFVL